MTGSITLPYRLIAAGDIFFGAYLLLVAAALIRSSFDLRARAANEDEGIFVVIAIVLCAISSCCVAIIVLLHQSHGELTWRLGIALAAAPLGWLTLHLVAAFHYANLYYAPGASGRAAAPPLQFPGTHDPTAWDFVYYAFVVGMTAQVSDVQVLSAKLRRATLGHGVISFLFNTVLIAMAVNAVVALAG